MNFLLIVLSSVLTNSISVERERGKKREDDREIHAKQDTERDKYVERDAESDLCMRVCVCVCASMNN